MRGEPSELWSLVPRPRRVALRSGVLELDPQRPLRYAATGGAACASALALLRERLPRAGGATLGERSARDPTLVLSIEPGHAPGAYRLTVDGLRACLFASDVGALRDAAATFVQLWRSARRAGPRAAVRLPALEIEDVPAIAARGYMLDVSRSRVPSTPQLVELVGLLAELKFNELHLYFEHAFAYEGHERVWRDASPVTASELAALETHADRLGVSLVPHQQSLGHMHRWLVHEPYRRLAECPEGIEHPFSLAREPYGLCPTDPAALAFVCDLHRQLFACTRSPWLHVGLDETIDLGQGRSSAACKDRGAGRVWLEWLCALHAHAAGHGRQIRFWADVLTEHPEVLADVPRDAMACLWGYEAGHDFESGARALSGAGLSFVVCPGTSSWQSLGGRVANARANVRQAARSAVAHGASGLLLTDWGDFGHLQPPPVSWPGLVLGAEAAWSGGTGEIDLAGALATQVFDDAPRSAAEALIALGEIGEASGARSVNGSPLFFLLRFGLAPWPHARIEGLTTAGLRNAGERIEEARGALDAARAASPRDRLALAEIEWVADALRFATRLGSARLAAPPPAPLALLPASHRRALAHELETLVARHRELWPERSRPGGLDESAAHLERLLPALHGTS